MVVPSDTVSIPGVGHGSEVQVNQGVLITDIIETLEGSLDCVHHYDPSQKAHIRQFNRCMKAGWIDILKVSPDVLARLEPAFKSKKVKGILEDLRDTATGESAAMKDMEKADLAVIKSKEIERDNLDPGAVDSNRKVLRERIATLEDIGVKLGTYQRKKVDLWERFYQSLDDFNTKKVEADVKAIMPDLEKYNNVEKANNQFFWKNIAPALKKLHDLNPGTPGEVYFTHLNFTEAQIRQIKTCAAFPQIVVKDNIFSFHLEVQSYGRK